MSDQSPDFTLSELVVLASDERERLGTAIDELLPLLSTVPELSPAFGLELQAARPLAAGGSYHYDSMSGLLAKQMLNLATFDLSPEVNGKIGEVLKAHLDVRLGR